ncbi:hypothetical protein [Amorphus coralli]|uniref:hypothetical protein n=1 Tax=Amorphus coralli TaxID=340680 RepID=UPI000420A300|nr:hypothetical protein [Amorphus coralli]
MTNVRHADLPGRSAAVVTSGHPFRKKTSTLAPHGGSFPLVAVIVALLTTLFAFLPVLGVFQGVTAGWPGFMLTGDVRMAWFPQFVEGYNRFWSGGIFGVDFLTHGGASDFGLRPNMLPAYPLFVLSYLLFDVSDITTAGVVFAGLHALHFFAGALFTSLLCWRYLGLSRGASLFASIAFVLSFHVSSYIAYTPFWFQAMLMPVLAYVLCWLLFARHWFAPLLAVPVIVTYMLTSYVPMMVGGLAVAAILCLAVYYIRFIRPLRWRSAAPRIWAPAVASVLSVLIVAPYYLAQFHYMRLVAEPHKSLNAVAHMDALNGHSIVAALSQFSTVAPPVESRLFFGFAALLVIVCGLALLAGGLSASVRSRTVLSITLATFLVFAIAALGAATVASDAFYYAVPVLGRMHLYVRYLLFAGLPFAIALAICADWIARLASARQRTAIFLSVVIFWGAFSVWLALSGEAHKYFIVDSVLVEAFLAMLCVAILVMGRTSLTVALSAIPLVLVSSYPMFNIQRLYGQHGAFQAFVDFEDATKDRLVGIFRDYPEQKDLTKVLSLSEGVDTYFPLNEPWLLSDRIKVMSYSGYDAVLAMENAYHSMMGGWFGRYNREWVLRTGVDFILWDEASRHKLSMIAADTVTFGATHPVGNMYLTQLIYSEPARIGQSSALVRVREGEPIGWSPHVIDGWDIKNGILVKPDNGMQARAGVAIKPLEGATYEVSVEVRNSSVGKVFVALGGTTGEGLPGEEPGVHTRTFTSDGKGDFWITATSDFDGEITNIVVRDISSEVPRAQTVLADNGILRLEGNPGTAALTSFSTNWTKKVTASVEGTEPSQLVFELWPNASWQPYLNGEPVEWEMIGTWPPFVTIPAGNHFFKLRYENIWTTLFGITVWTGIGVVAVAVVGAGVTAARSRRRRQPRAA